MAYGRATEHVNKLKKTYKQLSLDVIKKKGEFQRTIGTPAAQDK